MGVLARTARFTSEAVGPTSQRSVPSSPWGRKTTNVSTSKIGIEDVWPLTSVQEGLLFHAQYDRAGEDPYLVHSCSKWMDTVGPEIASNARCDPQRHAALRVSFAATHRGQPVQLVHRHCPIPWQYHDLTDLDPDTGRERSLGFECTDRQTRFTLDQAPLIRATLLRLAPNQHRLLLTQHHLLGDGWSGTLLLRDLLMVTGKGPRPSPGAIVFNLPVMAAEAKQGRITRCLASLS